MLIFSDLGEGRGEVQWSNVAGPFYRKDSERLNSYFDDIPQFMPLKKIQVQIIKINISQEF